MAQFWLTSQDGTGARGPSTVLTIPVGLRMNRNTPIIATLAVTYGARKLGRKKARNGIGWLGALVNSGATATDGCTLMTRKSSALRNAWRTAGSLNAAS